MTKSENRIKAQIKAKGLRRLTARFALFIGAIGAFGFMLWAIYKNDSITRLVLYSLWVMSPFFALFFTKFTIQSKLVLRNKMLYNLMILTSLFALFVYFLNAITPLASPQAFIFLIVPLVCWSIIVLILINAYLKLRKINRNT